MQYTTVFFLQKTHSFCDCLKPTVRSISWKQHIIGKSEVEYKPSYKSLNRGEKIVNASRLIGLFFLRLAALEVLCRTCTPIYSQIGRILYKDLHLC